ncbi:MAG: nicotinate-nucleotide--dimethylbenzimidazole phosphoribosyltransferase [Gammaproteobacteria bacterium]|nr:MAG: nicotinate-nucleotide--dimethylbenzimidazole phosphoribosyltransferase [Gammaproteobacteria bacterium]
MSEFPQWLTLPVKAIDEQSQKAAEQRQQLLTKPAGSLGQLETIAIQLAAMQATETPSADKVHISVFAADHGIVDEGISAFPQAVTAEMIRNFANGGAAISVLAKELNASLDVINMGTINPLEPLSGVSDQRIAAGTANFAQQAAMSLAHCQQAILVGRNNVEQAYQADIDLFIAGEMGIGNTTSATAIAAALLNLNAKELTGPGTGLNAEGVSHKAFIIEQALNKHREKLSSPLTILHTLGGFEIAALVGCYLACGKQGLPVIIDGYISSVAALMAETLCPGTKHWFIYSHNSAEPGHQHVLSALKATTLLDIGMRLGEASGAASVLPLIRLSCTLHNQMATFEQAEVSEKS